MAGVWFSAEQAKVVRGMVLESCGLREDASEEKGGGEEKGGRSGSESDTESGGGDDSGHSDESPPRKKARSTAKLLGSDYDSDDLFCDEELSAFDSASSLGEDD